MRKQAELFGVRRPGKPREPDPRSDAGRILSRLRSAYETQTKPTISSESPVGSVDALSLSQVCIDYRSRISDLRRMGHSIECVEVSYTDWRGRTRRIGCRYLTNYRAELPVT